MNYKFTKNVGLKIMAVLFAICLWFIVVKISDPADTMTYRNIAVSVLHGEMVTNKGKTYQVTDNTQMVTVSVKAKRSVLSKIKQSDIVATADMKEIQVASMIPIKVSVNGFEGKYEATANPTNMQVSIEDEANNIFPITASTTGTLRDGYVLGEIKSNPEKVQLSGPASLVGRISRVVAKVDVSGLSSDKVLNGTLVVYDSEDKIIDQTLLSNNLGEGGVSVDIKLLETKSVGLAFNVSGAPADGYTYASMKYEPMEIQVAGPAEILEELEVIDIPSSELDISNLSSKKEIVVDISKHLPEEVFLVDGNADSVVVTIAIERVGTRAMELPIGSIKLNNVASSLKASFGNSEVVAMEFIGAQESLDNLTLDKIEASIDLKTYKDPGTFEMPVLVEAPGCSLVGTVVVKVVLEKQ